MLQETEDPDSYLKKRPLSCPVLIVGSSYCLLAVGDVAITILDKLTESALYFMAYYYTLHLTYPKCVATLLSIIQRGRPLRQNPEISLRLTRRVWLSGKLLLVNKSSGHVG